ncbi:MAG: FGGY family pentulose kinase [Pseudomonadota bacterium]
MKDKIALFWPGDYRPQPNEDALPNVRVATQQLEKALSKLGRKSYRVEGFLTKPHEAIESLCSTVCKWTYLGHEPSVCEESIGKWDETYWRQIDLSGFVEDNFAKIGQRVRPMGESVGKGLTNPAAKDLGLLPGTPVSISIIDAHAGGLGVLGAGLSDKELLPEQLEKRLALIGGTSSCHMAVSKEPRFVPGVWGPYFSAMVPNMWLTEGGQSATGALIDHVIYSHARAADLNREAKSSGQTIYELLNSHLKKLAQQKPLSLLTKDLHVLPYFHGNRSPRADASLRGMICGLRPSDSLDDLALLYLATIQAIAHGTRHIVDTMNSHGYSIEAIFACGGGTKNPVFLQEHTDAIGCKITLPAEPEAVLLGSALLGAVASGDFPNVIEAMTSMSKTDQVVEPKGGPIAAFHQAKHSVFQKMYEDQMAYRSMVPQIGMSC